jgi:hypothetical protein
MGDVISKEQIAKQVRKYIGNDLGWDIYYCEGFIQRLTCEADGV